MIVWNRYEFTIKALDSLFSNTNHPYYLFLLDNNSEEKVKQYLKDLDKTQESSFCCGIDIHFRKRSYGVFKNMQKLWRIIMRKFEGNITYWCKLDNDTIVPANWLTKLVKLMDTKTNLDIVQADHLMLTPKKYRTKKDWLFSMKKEEVVIDNLSHNLFYNSYVGGSGIIIRNTEKIKEVMSRMNFYKKVWGWTVEQQKRINNGHNIAFFDGVFITLLDVEEDNVLNNEFISYYRHTRRM